MWLIQLLYLCLGIIVIEKLVVVVDGCCSKLANAVSGVPQGSVLGPLLFLLYTAELFSVVENRLYGYTDDSTLVAVVPSPSERVAVSVYES